jgi:hypothetical protein
MSETFSENVISSHFYFDGGERASRVELRRETRTQKTEEPRVASERDSVRLN